MSDLSTRILNALDEAVAQEVGARLRQAAQNVPTGSARPTLPAQFEESLKRLKALYTQVKAIVDRTFGDPVTAATSTSTAQTFACASEFARPGDARGPSFARNIPLGRYKAKIKAP
jgi:hypothetical protein